MRATVATLSILTALAARPAEARVPTAASVMEKAVEWVRGLSATPVRYRLQQRGVDAGQAVLRADRVLEGEHPALSGAAFRLMTRLFTSPSSATLSNAGVDLDVTSLFHLNRRVVVIVGAQPMKPGVAQVWFDRKTGRPVRIIVPLGDGAMETLTLRGPWPPHLDWTGRGGKALTAVPRW